MQYTTHYNMNVPEGTDIVNPLVQDNPNWNTIDAALYANKLRVIGTATELTTGTVHALTRTDNDIPVFRFVATSDYDLGDTFTVDGVTVTATEADGTTLKDKAYVINSSILGILDGTKLTLIGTGGTEPAIDVSYDNNNSGIAETNVQDAIDVAFGRISALNGRISVSLPVTTGQHFYPYSNMNLPAGFNTSKIINAFQSGGNPNSYPMIISLHNSGLFVNASVDLTITVIIVYDTY